MNLEPGIIMVPGEIGAKPKFFNFFFDQMQAIMRSSRVSRGQSRSHEVIQGHSRSNYHQKTLRIQLFQVI